MFLQKCTLVCSRSLSRSAVSKILSPAFTLDKEWSARHSELKRLVGGDYEWISAVQKKFIGGGYASAVDVDAAVCIAEQKDQVNDVLELLYKLRHTEVASELAESSEYAIVRLLLKFDADVLFTVVNDPINYGIFLNEHSACLAIDHFVKRNNYQGAARLVSFVMQQEQTDNELLNLLGLYTCSKWVELPKDQQTLPLPVEDEEEVNDDDVRTFKFPYLKNAHFDSHFDLDQPAHLVGKSLFWIARSTKSIDQQLSTSLQLLGAVLYDKHDLAESLASSSTTPQVANVVRQILTPTEEGAEVTPAAQKILEKLPPASETTEQLSTIVQGALEKIQSAEEKSLGQEQVSKFTLWNERRQELVKAQAQRVLLKVRAEEIKQELDKLDREEERMGFFVKRLWYEKKAAENEQIEQEAKERNDKVAAQA